MVCLSDYFINIYRVKTVLKHFWVFCIFSFHFLFSAPLPNSVGMSLPLTGPSAWIGREIYRGSFAYFQWSNQLKKDPKDRVKVTIYDDQYDTLNVLKNTIRLVEGDDSCVLFAYFGVSSVDSISPLLKKYSKDSEYPLFLFFPHTRSRDYQLKNLHKHVFEVRGNYNSEATQVVEKFLSLGYRRFSIAYQKNADGKAAWSAFYRALKKEGLKFVSEGVYCPKASFKEDFNSQAHSILKGKPDVLLQVGSYACCAGLIRDLRNLGSDLPIVHSSLVGAEAVLELLKKQANKNKISYTQKLVFIQRVPWYHDPFNYEASVYKRHLEKLVERYPDLGPVSYSHFAFEAYLNAKHMVQLLQKGHGYVSLEILKQALFPNDRFSAIFSTNFNQKSKKSSPIYYTHIVSENVVPLYSWDKW